MIQAAKIIKLKLTKNVSVYAFVMILIISIMWLFYGIKIISLPLIIGNSIKLIASFIVVVAYLVYIQPRSSS